MIELTLADLMAIDYWRTRGWSWIRIGNKLGLTAKQIELSFIDPSLKWATESIRPQLVNKDA
jgi:hypothetical protein